MEKGTRQQGDTLDCSAADDVQYERRRQRRRFRSEKGISGKRRRKRGEIWRCSWRKRDPYQWRKIGRIEEMKSPPRRRRRVGTMIMREQRREGEGQRNLNLRRERLCGSGWMVVPAMCVLRMGPRVVAFNKQGGIRCV